MDRPDRPTIVIISADAEWRAVHKLFPDAPYRESPFGEWFPSDLNGPAFGRRNSEPGTDTPVIFFQGGWGKISAAASAQYAIDRWSPGLIVNLGTCGGFEGAIERGAILLVDRTIVYDIIEQMGDNEEHIAHYSTRIDLSWLKEPYPIPVIRSLMVSGDRDLVVEDLPLLRAKYGAVAGDWESGAIAFVARRNQLRTLILRGVTDLVGLEGSEAYANLEFFERSALEILKRLVQSLPDWLQSARAR